MRTTVNKVILIGNVYGKPKVHYFDSGAKVCNFILRVQSYTKVGDSLKSDPELISCSVWGDVEPQMEFTIHDKARIYVEGRLKTVKESKQKGYVIQTFVYVDDFMLIQGKNG